MDPETKIDTKPATTGSGEIRWPIDELEGEGELVIRWTDSGQIYVCFAEDWVEED